MPSVAALAHMLAPNNQLGLTAPTSWNAHTGSAPNYWGAVSLPSRRHAFG